MKRFYASICLIALVVSFVSRAGASQKADELYNHDFETGDLTGWIIERGDAFSNGDVTNKAIYQNGIPFYQQGIYHLWGSEEGGNEQTGVLRSVNFILGGDGKIDFLIGGGRDPENLYIALVRASDGEELFKATGDEFEDYVREEWDASDYIGAECYIKIVDNVTEGEWGHINVDDVNVPVSGKLSLMAGMTVTDALAPETDDDMGVVTINRLGDTEEELVVLYQVAETSTAKEGEDIEPLSGRVIIPAGQTSADVTIHAIDDDQFEENEQLVIELVAHEGYQIGGENRAVISIPWNDAREGIPNHDFETGDLTGWEVVEGDAFSIADVTNRIDWDWAGPFNQNNSYHLWGYAEGGDAQVGLLKSKNFTLVGDGQLDLLVGGGKNIEKLYVALARASDGKELFKATGSDWEGYRKVYWDASAYIGEECYIKVVDQALGGWGHINVDDINVPIEGEAEETKLTAIELTAPDFEFTPERIAEWYAADPYRPQYHFSAVQNWINDPNGLIQWNGEYHLFYQHHPYSTSWGPMHWGHAVSKDLVHWKHLPIALAPEKSDKKKDISGIFSGSAVDDNGILTLVYTDFTDTKAHPGATIETQAIAASTDGIHFEKYEGNPVVARPPAESSAGFRDPKVWKDTDGLWKMVIGSGHAGKGRVQIYSSPDLRDWMYGGVLFEGDGTNGKMWECPDLFPLGDKHVLLVSVNDSGFQTTFYFVGQYQDNRFIAEKSGDIDFGPDFYAAQTFEDEQGRRIMIAWMERWGGTMPTQATNWAGSMSLPRQLFLLPTGHVGTRPVSELQSLRSTEQAAYQFKDVVVTPESSDLLSEVKGDTVEILAEIQVNDPNTEAFGFELRKSPDDREKLVITYNVKEETLAINRNLAGIGDRGMYSTRLNLLNEKTLKLHIYIDRSSAEVFLNDGEAAASVRFYPHWQESMGIDVFAKGGEMTVKSIALWELASAWEQ